MTTSNARNSSSRTRWLRGICLTSASAAFLLHMGPNVWFFGQVPGALYWVAVFIVPRMIVAFALIGLLVAFKPQRERASAVAIVSAAAATLVNPFLAMDAPDIDYTMAVAGVVLLVVAGVAWAAVVWPSAARRTSRPGQPNNHT